MIKRNKKAMTLIEMLIVLVLVGFLIGELVKVFGAGMEISGKREHFKTSLIEFKSRLSNAMFGKQNLYSFDSSQPDYNPTDGMMVNMTIQNMNDLIAGRGAFTDYEPLRDTNGRFYEVKTLQVNNLMLDECYDKTFSQKGTTSNPMISCTNMGVIRFIGVGDNGQQDGDNDADDIIDNNNVLSQGDDMYEDINLKLEYFDNLQRVRNLHNTLVNMIYGVAVSARQNFLVDNILNYGNAMSEERVSYSYSYNMFSDYNLHKRYQNKKDTSIGFFTGSINKSAKPIISELSSSLGGLISNNPFRLGIGNHEIVINSIPSVIRNDIKEFIPPSNPCVSTKTCIWKEEVNTNNYFAIPFSTNAEKTEIFYKVYNIKM